MTDPLRAAITAMNALGMRITDSDGRICTVVCKACGWRGERAVIERLAEEPHGCVRCEARQP